jgi:hypothetical protein
MHVDQERTAGDDVRLAPAARQQSTWRLLCHRSDGGHRHCASEDSPGGRYGGGTCLAKDKRIRHLALHDPDSNWLKLELTHPADCSDAISAIRQRSRKLGS